MSEMTHFEEVSISDILQDELFCEMAQRVSYDGHISEELFHIAAKKAMQTWERISGKSINDIFLEDMQAKIKDVTQLGRLIRMRIEQIIPSSPRLDKAMRVVKIYLRLIFIE